MNINDMILVVTGKYAGESGKVISVHDGPKTKERRITVLRANLRAFQVDAKECRLVDETE